LHIQGVAFKFLNNTNSKTWNYNRYCRFWRPYWRLVFT